MARASRQTPREDLIHSILVSEGYFPKRTGIKGNKKFTNQYYEKRLRELEKKTYRELFSYLELGCKE